MTDELKQLKRLQEKIEEEYKNVLRLQQERNAIIRRLAKDGVSMASIGRTLGISRQRVKQIVS